tara:strand:+ start:12699 stop:13250 length:552 start_codon:yes stop_codon:yes gene_type:complete
MYLYRIKDLTTLFEMDFYRTLSKTVDWYDHDIVHGVVRKGMDVSFYKPSTNYNLTVLDRHHYPATAIAKRYGIKPSYISMVHSAGNTSVGKHIDNKLRQVNFSFPIYYGTKEHYREITYYDGDSIVESHKYAWPCLINAKQPHSASNHYNILSCMLQISTVQPWDEVVNNLKEKGLIIETSEF